MTDPKVEETRAVTSGAGSPQHDVHNTLVAGSRSSTEDHLDLNRPRRVPEHGVLQKNTVSRQVAWFEVYSFAQRFAANHDLDLLDIHLVPGTPAWCQMADDDARKLLSLVLGGVREALANDTHQAAIAEAAQEISGAADWTALAQRIRGRASNAYIPRRAS